MRFAFRNQHRHQVGHQLDAVFRRELDDTFCLKLVDAQLDHANRAIDDASAGGDHCLGLLPPQHGAGNFRGVGEVRDARLDDFQSGERNVLLYLMRLTSFLMILYAIWDKNRPEKKRG